MPTFQFYLRGSSVAEIRGADPSRLESTIEQYAPSTADVSFSGSGQQLGSSSGGPPKVNWDAPPTQDDDAQARREAMAKAAANRFSAAPKPEPPVSKPVAPAVPPAGPSNVTPTTTNESADANGESEADKMVDETVNENETVNDPRLNVDPSLLQKLEEMGFPRIRAEKALILTGNKSLEPAMEWCFEHADDPDIDEPLAMVTEDGIPKAVLSAEERKKRADEVLRKARARRQESEKTEELQREKDRIRSGKEVTEAKRSYEEHERKRAVELKRKEKHEAMLQKKRIKELVEADRIARREKFKNRSGGSSSAAPAPPPVVAPPKPTVSPSGGKLQLRFPDGSRIEPHFEPEQVLGDVVAKIVEERPQMGAGSLRLSQQYPRRVFTESDYGLSLQELKLLPRGVLNVTQV